MKSQESPVEKLHPTSNFYDYSYKPVLTWKLQSFLFKNVDYFFDKKQKAYCRKVNNVRGWIIEDEEGKKFYPHWNLLVNYFQRIDEKPITNKHHQ